MATQPANLAHSGLVSGRVRACSGVEGVAVGLLGRFCVRISANRADFPRLDTWCPGQEAGNA